MKNEFRPKGVCSQKVNFDIKDGLVTSLRFDGGCEGNLKGVSAVVLGRPAREVADIRKGITCGKKKTSCSDQLSKAREKAIKFEDKTK